MSVFRRDRDQKDSTRGPQMGMCPPLLWGFEKAPSPVGKSGGPTTLTNSLNISRNAVFLNIQAVSEEKIFKTFFPQGPMLKLCRLMAAILVGRRGHRIQY